jgi:tetratricopeptide (TPR) repeat protein
MQTGAALQGQKKFAEAAGAYHQALHWQPGDAKATAAVRAAEYLQHMTEGQRLLAARKFPDAAREFDEALKIFPSSADAKNYLQKARSGKP